MFCWIQVAVAIIMQGAERSGTVAELENWRQVKAPARAGDREQRRAGPRSRASTSRVQAIPRSAIRET
jgi:hypothetical protein